MSKSILDVMWEQEMRGINDRLSVLSEKFRTILAWSSSDAGLLDFRRWPNVETFHEFDEQLIKHLVQKWLPEVNAFVQRGALTLLDEAATASFFVEDVMLMRAVETHQIEVILEDIVDPMEFVAARADELLGFHQAVAQRTTVEEGLRGLQVRQDKYVRENFPRALAIDLRLLDEVFRWRVKIHKRLVNPYLERAARQFDGSQESITQIMIEAVKIAQGPAAALR